MKVIAIENRVVKLIVPNSEARRRLVKDSRITPIEISSKIK
jgi:hypothetical protein